MGLGTPSRLAGNRDLLPSTTPAWYYVSMTATRICSRCRVEKPLAAFHRRPNRPSNRHYACRKCISTAMRVERPQPPVVSEKDLGYFAALIDGEGSVCITSVLDRRRVTRYWVLQLRIYNSYLPVLEWLIPRFGGKIFTVKARTPKHKEGYAWIATTRYALVLLEFVHSTLIIKRRHAEIALEFFARMWAIKDEDRDNGIRIAHVRDETLLRLFEELKTLNRRGPPVH